MVKLPKDAVSSALNYSSVNRHRTGSEAEYRLHVSDVIESTGPRAFCAREHVLTNHTPRLKDAKRLSPARKLLFATGHFLHDYVVREFMDNSPYAKYVYADWTCVDYHKAPHKHDKVLDTYGNVIAIKCRCGLPLDEHNEIELTIRGLVGHPDLIFLIDDMYHIREFKTYERKDIPFDDLNEVLPSHRLQVSSYWKMLWRKAKIEGRTVSSRIVVDYVDRSNAKLFGGWPFKSLQCRPYEDMYMRRIKNSVDHFNEGVISGLLPDRICSSIRDTRARQCDRAVECFLRKRKHVGSAQGEHSYKRIEA